MCLCLFLPARRVFCPILPRARTNNLICESAYTVHWYSAYTHRHTIILLKGDGQKTRNCAIFGLLFFVIHSIFYGFDVSRWFGSFSHFLSLSGHSLNIPIECIVYSTRSFFFILQQTIHLHFCGDLLWFLQYHCRSQMNTATTEEWACTHQKKITYTQQTRKIDIALKMQMFARFTLFWLCFVVDAVVIWFLF